MSTANSPYSPVQTSSAMPQPMVGYPAEVRFIIYFLILILVLPLALAADLVLHLSTQTVTYGCIALTAILVPASSLAYGRLMARKQAKLERILRLLPPEEMARLQQQLMTPEQMARLQRLLTPEQRARLQQLEHFEQLARQQTLST